MVKRRNKGFSIVEILIALAIFSILMIPIVRGLISSMKSTTQSKEVLYRNDFSENFMEFAKTVSFEELTDKKFLQDNLAMLRTSKGDGVESVEEVVNDEATGKKDYQIKGKVTVGTDKYNYLLDVDNSDYVDNGLNNSFDPNTMELGIVEDYDSNKVALIDTSILNYDKQKTIDYQARKLQELKKIDPVGYEQQMSNKGGSLFERDTCTRLIVIKVKDVTQSTDKNKKYQISCDLNYMEGNESGFLSDTFDREENVYFHVFESKDGTIPNIYMMYNPFFYNNGYMSNDYIAVDANGISSDEPINIFITEIAKTYSDRLLESDLKDDAGKDLLSKDKSLYNTNQKNGVSRDEVAVHLVAIDDGTATGLNSSGGLAYNSEAKVHIYHNMGDTASYSGDNIKTPASNCYFGAYSETQEGLFQSAGSGLDGTLDDMLTLLKKNDVYGSFTDFIDIDAGKTGDADVNWMNQASKKSRGLYKMKLWMKAESQGEIDTTTDTPVLTGTKGGNVTNGKTTEEQSGQ